MRKSLTFLLTILIAVIVIRAITVGRAFSVDIEKEPEIFYQTGGDLKTLYRVWCGWCSGMRLWSTDRNEVEEAIQGTCSIAQTTAIYADSGDGRVPLWRGMRTPNAGSTCDAMLSTNESEINNSNYNQNKALLGYIYTTPTGEANIPLCRWRYTNGSFLYHAPGEPGCPPFDAIKPYVGHGNGQVIGYIRWSPDESKCQTIFNPAPPPKTFKCEDIERREPSPQPGQTVAYTCVGKGDGLDRVDLRTIVDDVEGSIESKEARDGEVILFDNFVVPADATNVVAECRACGDGQCTDWGRSDQVISLLSPTPLPTSIPTSSPTPLPTPLPSLVINGSFENGTTGWAFWSEGSQGYQGIVVSGGYESSYAYRITTGTDQPSGWGRAACVGQNYNRNASFNNPANFAGKTLKLSGYIKTSASSTGAYLKLSITTPSGGRNPSWAPGGTNTINLQSWQYVEKVIDIPADVTKIEVDGCSGGAAGGQAWFDKAELVLNDKPPPP